LFGDQVMIGQDNTHPPTDFYVDRFEKGLRHGRCTWALRMNPPIQLELYINSKEDHLKG